jgi:hypothetical protein
MKTSSAVVVETLVDVQMIAVVVVEKTVMIVVESVDLLA